MAEVQTGMKSAGFDGLRLNPRQEANLLHMHRVIDGYLERVVGIDSGHGISEPGCDRAARLTGVPRDDELRQQQRPAVGARRRPRRNRSCEPPSKAGSTSSTPRTRTPRERAEVATGRLVHRYLSRDEAVIATKVFMPMTPGPERRWPLAQAHPLGDRRLAGAPRHRLRGPLPDPPLGSERAHRGDDGRAQRGGAGRQGSLHRRQQHACVAVREGAARCRAQRLGEVRVDAEPLQPALPRGGAGDDPAVPGPGDRRHPVEPARPGRAGGESHPHGGEAHDALEHRPVHRVSLQRG